MSFNKKITGRQDLKLISVGSCGVHIEWVVCVVKIYTEKSNQPETLTAELHSDSGGTGLQFTPVMEGFFWGSLEQASGFAE